MLKSNTIYLDHNATTPLHPEAAKAMEPFYAQVYGNPSSTHQKGRRARAALEESRAIIGDILGTESVDIIFTSGGTESDNMAVKGSCFANKNKGRHIITSSVEHLAVLEACKFIESEGFEVTYFDVDRYGMVCPEQLRDMIRPDTILVSIMHANNEVGTIQPIEEIAKIIKDVNSHRSSIGRKKAQYAKQVYFHVDACQTFGKMPIDVEDLGVDLLSISAHKIYGPKGIGALYIRKGIDILPHMHGGHHERGLRAGTENIASIAGFAKAAEIACENIDDYKIVKALRDRLWQGLYDNIEDIVLNGHPEKTLPTTLNIGFKATESEALLINLDIKGICASAGSACASGSVAHSHVLKAMKLGKDIVKGSVRFSLGVDNIDSDIDYCIKEIPPIVKRLRSV